MEVKPQYSPVGKLFESQPVYRVPAYQRAYSWEQLEIEDFIRDLEVCYNKRKYDTGVVHFFGQIVCIEDKVSGTSLAKFQLVDGQQRIATFTLLVLALINTYKEVLTNISGDATLNNQKGILNARILELSKRYLSFQKEVGDNFEDISVLELSNRDRAFFKGFLQNIAEVATLESHKLIKAAYTTIHTKLYDLTNAAALRDLLGNLKVVEQILDTDFCILKMVTNDRKAAFKLFQVLNNRGKNLTEGDLLRAESLRLLEPHPTIQPIVETAWDNVLTDKPADTEKFLRAIYGSHKGQKAGTNSLFNDFIGLFIPEYEFENIEAADANRIQGKVQKIERDIVMLRKLHQGAWPFDQRPPIEHWDRNRLSLIFHALHHFECLPLLLSATLLDHSTFSQIVQLIERFVFRYLVIGNQYVGDLTTIYHEEAKVIRDNPGVYRIASLKAKLTPLEQRITDDTFTRNLDNLVYREAGKSNKPLKYFLLTLEYYHRWYAAGATGDPECMERQRVYDFTDSTIEHIYPNHAAGATLVADLEPLKQQIGNLTILGNTDNRTGDNDDFATKKPIYAQSSLGMNQAIATNATWTRGEVETRITLMKAMACRIFKI